MKENLEQIISEFILKHQWGNIWLVIILAIIRGEAPIFEVIIFIFQNTLQGKENKLKISS